MHMTHPSQLMISRNKYPGHNTIFTRSGFCPMCNAPPSLGDDNVSGDDSLASVATGEDAPRPSFPGFLVPLKKEN